MDKKVLFLKLYRGKVIQNIILFVLFTLLSTCIVTVLFVQANNANGMTQQALEASFGHSNLRGGSEFAIQSMENILGMIASAAVCIAAFGGLALISFRNKGYEKALIMMKMSGMKKTDLCIKAMLDAIIYAIGPSVIGFFIGYGIFRHFVEHKMQIPVCLGLLDVGSIMALLVAIFLLSVIVYVSNLIVDFSIYEKSPSEFLYGRKGKNSGKQSLVLTLLEIALVCVILICIFHVKKNVFFSFFAWVFLLSGILFLLYGVILKRARKKRERTRMSHMKDLTRCFLCSRYKRNAFLAIVISMGALIVCVMANIAFNIGGVLKSAYQENMGYTVLVRERGDAQQSEIAQSLNDNKIAYTCAHSKLLPYAALNGVSTEGMFWALVIDEQTDENTHFSVEPGTFLAENYFANRCGLQEGIKTDIFGKTSQCVGRLTDNQYMSLVSYNFIINREDWALDIDDEWHTIFLIDATRDQEKLISGVLSGYDIEIESASGLIDEIKDGAQFYFDVLILVAGMVVLVTATIFYTIIREDLKQRMVEMYLYKVYGASNPKIYNVVSREYLWISIMASVAVTATVMLLGEFFVFAKLGKHFPLSLPIAGMVVALSIAFVYVCCLAAGIMHLRKCGIEGVRDE